MITAGLAIKIAFLASVALIWLMIMYQVVMTVAGFVHRVRSARLTRQLRAQGGPLPPVSILIPARNEEVVIESTLEAMRRLEYPGGPLEIMVIDDGSTDRTAEIVEAVAARDPRVRLVRLPVIEQGRGKSHALNTALRHVSHEIVAVYDADNRPEPPSLEILVRRLLRSDRLGAVLGKFRTLNRARNLLTSFINLETLAFQWIVQAGRCALFGVGILPGTNFVVRRAVLLECQGWDEKAVTEDTELSIRIYQRGWTIDFAPEAVSWEEEPERFRVWVKQRTRWVTGNLYVLRKFMFSSWKLPNKFLALQILYLSILYYLFLLSVLVSHGIFLACVTGWLRVDIPGPYNLVWVGAFVLFVAELYLVTCYEGEHRLREIGVAALMYLTYCQAWLIVVFRALWNEYVRKQGSLWDKTARFGTPPEVESRPLEKKAEEKKAASAPAGRSPYTILLLSAALSLLPPPAGGQSVLESFLEDEPLMDSHWGETYLQLSYETYHDKNLVGLLDVKDGFRLLWLKDTQLFLYAKARAYKDTAEQYWNNKAVFGPGLRLKPLPEVGFFFFAEYLFGLYYGIEGRDPNPHDQFIHGVEAGAAFFDRWGELPPDTGVYYPFTGWRELYGDAIYFQYDDDNFIATTQGRVGWGTIRAGPVLTDFYLGVHGAGDINQDYWNNYVEGTLGLRLRPSLEEVDLRLSVELVGGYFIDRDGRFELPWDETYLGARFEVTFWFGWGGEINYEEAEG